MPTPSTNPHLPENPLTDSSGVPWEGRAFEANPWQDDDGSCPPKLAAVLAQLKQRAAGVEQLAAALPGNRLLVPLIAELGDSEVGANGLRVDKSAELSLVAVGTPDGATAIPAFTDVAAMRVWRADARPVPVGIEKLALAAAGEGHTRVVINPGSQPVALRLPQLKALASNTNWTNPAANPAVLSSVARVLGTEHSIRSHQVTLADPFGTLLSAELEFAIGLTPGLTQSQLEELTRRVATTLRELPEFDEVDSFSFKLQPASTD